MMRFHVLPLRMTGKRVCFRSLVANSASLFSTLAPSPHCLPANILEECIEKATTINWDDRIKLQNLWNLQEKGWKVAVEWKITPFGVGLFAAESIPSGAVLRQGVIGRNLLQFRKQGDIESFCRVTCNDEMEHQARLKYVADYLWGFDLVADERGYPCDLFEKGERFFGMWIPGNGLNHNNEPNTVYVPRKNTDTDLIGINLVALGDIKADEELYDDYRRHGSAPEWLRDFAVQKGISLNFAECNDFVCSASKISDEEEKPV